MKTKLTVTIDRDLVPAAKRYAKARGVSLSSLIETALADMAGQDRGGFSKNWTGSMALAERDDDRYAALVAKYR